MSCDYKGSCKAGLHILGGDIFRFLAREFVPVVSKNNHYSDSLIQIKGKIGQGLVSNDEGMVKLGPDPEKGKVKFAFHVLAEAVGRLQKRAEVLLISQEQSQGIPEVKVKVPFGGADFQLDKDRRVTVKLKQEAE